jgi:hypothetical protein
MDVDQMVFGLNWPTFLTLTHADRFTVTCMVSEVMEYVIVSTYIVFT